MKKDFLKLVKRHAKQTPKTIGRIVVRLLIKGGFYLRAASIKIQPKRCVQKWQKRTVFTEIKRFLC